MCVCMCACARAYEMKTVSEFLTLFHFLVAVALRYIILNYVAHRYNLVKTMRFGILVRLGNSVETSKRIVLTKL